MGHCATVRFLCSPKGKGVEPIRDYQTSASERGLNPRPPKVYHFAKQSARQPNPRHTLASATGAGAVTGMGRIRRAGVAAYARRTPQWTPA